MFDGNTLERGEGLLEGLQVLAALRFYDASCCPSLSFLDSAGCAVAHLFAGPAVGIHHAPAAPLIAELRPLTLEVGLRAAIGQPGAAGVLLFHSPVAGLLFPGCLLILFFAELLVHLDGVLAHFGAPFCRHFLYFQMR